MSLLKDNRFAFDQLLNCQKTFPEDLCTGTVHVESIIEKLSEAFLSLDLERRNDLQESASQLFYLLAELIDDDIKQCYPAIQFFSSGVEALGKVIPQNPPILFNCFIRSLSRVSCYSECAFTNVFNFI